MAHALVLDRLSGAWHHERANWVVRRVSEMYPDAAPTGEDWQYNFSWPWTEHHGAQLAGQQSLVWENFVLHKQPCTSSLQKHSLQWVVPWCVCPVTGCDTDGSTTHTHGGNEIAGQTQPGNSCGQELCCHVVKNKRKGYMQRVIPWHNTSVRGLHTWDQLGASCMLKTFTTPGVVLCSMICTSPAPF